MAKKVNNEEAEVTEVAEAKEVKETKKVTKKTAKVEGGAGIEKQGRYSA